MFQVVISLFLVINVSNAFDKPGEQRTVSEGQNRTSIVTYLAGITTVKNQIARQSFCFVSNVSAMN